MNPVQQLGVDDFEYPPYAGWRTPEVIEDVLKRRGRLDTSETIATAARDKSRLARQLIEQTQFDTPITTTDCNNLNSGNSNCGHPYGTQLSDPEKKALLEYLKTL